MKNLITKIQKDLGSLQDTLEKESNVIIKRIKDAANEIAKNQNVAKRRKEIEKAIRQQKDKFEPAITKFFSEMAKGAKKYGIDVSRIEKGLKGKAGAAKKVAIKKTKKIKKKVETVAKKSASKAKKKS